MIVYGTTEPNAKVTLQGEPVQFVMTAPLRFGLACRTQADHPGYIPATLGVVTNIDNDHLDHYGTLQAVEDAFVEFVAMIPFYGLTAVCGEDEGVRRCLPRFTKPVVTYGFSAQWDYYADEIAIEGTGSTFRVWRRAQPEEKHQLLGAVTLRVPGRHNVLNSLGAIGVAMKLEIPFQKIAQALAEFGGVKRRFEIRWENKITQQAIVDDYGHHPTEILATLAAARQIWKGRIVTVFQPHRYSRTLHCREDFSKAFGDSDVVLITDIYAAGEEPIEGVSSQALVELLRKRAQGAGKKSEQIRYSGDLEQTRSQILAGFLPGDLILCLGAGSITKLADQLSKSV